MKEKESRLSFSQEELEQRTAEELAELDSRKRPRYLAKEKYPGSQLREKRGSVKAQSAKLVQSGTAVVSRSLHAKAREYEEGNAGTQAMNETEEMAEAGVRKVASGHFSQKLKSYDKAEKLEDPAEAGKGIGRGSVRKGRAEAKPEDGASRARRQQRQAIRKEYAAAKTGRSTGTAAGSAAFGEGKAVRGVEKAGKAARDVGKKVAAAAKRHPLAFLIVGVLALLVLVIVSTVSSCSAMISEGGSVILASSYTAADEEILAAEAAYCALEEGLRERIRNVEEETPGYDEYVIQASEIGHDPYALAALLTVLYEDYTLEEVRGTLDAVFAAQYEYATRVRTETVEDEDTDETAESSEGTSGGTKRILIVEVINHSLNGAIASLGLTEDEMVRFHLLVAQRGNREDLFADNIYANPTAILHYDIPGEALSDVRFARMIQEGEKYLGYPYVWGGSSPSTSFDCSGFVSWVINHSGNGWNVGRPSAEGLRQLCAIIPAAEAKPGDLIFFQGTYETAGASHVGIYVGDGMMLHCGNPIQYESTETAFWQQHFYCFGRLPG